MYKYLVLVEKGKHNYSAYAPDVPGCVSAGDTVDETLQNFQEALKLHLEGMFEDGDVAPPPTIAAAEFVQADIEVPAVTRTA